MIKKIGIVCDQCVDIHFPPHFSEVYTDLLHARSYRTSVAAFYRDPENPNVTALQDRGLHLLKKTAKGGILGRTIYNLRLIPRLKHLIGNPAFRDSDAWIVHNDPLHLYLVLRHARKRGQYVLYRPTHLMPEELLESESLSRRLMGRIARAWRNRLIPKCDAVLPISGEAAHILLAQVSYPDQRMIPLYSAANPLPDNGNDHNIPEKLQSFPVKNWLCYIGTLNAARQLSLLTDTLKHLPGAGLLVLGIARTEAEKDLLTSSAETAGVADRLLIHPPVPEKDLPAILKHMDIGLSPFPTDTVMRANAPLKTLDYILCGLPVVASRIPAHIEIFSQCEAGILVDNSGENFAEAARQLLYEHPDRRNTRIESGQSWIARNRSLQSACDVLELAFTRCLKNEETPSWQKSA